MPPRGEINGAKPLIGDPAEYDRRLVFSAAAALTAGAQDVQVNTAAPKSSASDAGLYIVQMIDAPVVAYTGGVPGLSPPLAPGGRSSIHEWRRRALRRVPRLPSQ